MSHHEHKSQARAHVGVAVITVSDTRTEQDDTSALLVRELLEAAGHTVTLRTIVRDDVGSIRAAVEAGITDPSTEAIVLTGGTGVGPRDVTPEAVAPLLQRQLPGFGELFRMLSWQEIGAASLASRALAGVASGCVVFALPGSRAAVRLALEKLILPEVAHLAGEASGRRAHRSGGRGTASSK